jgi:hypothetical protein
MASVKKANHFCMTIWFVLSIPFQSVPTSALHSSMVLSSQSLAARCLARSYPFTRRIKQALVVGDGKVPRRIRSKSHYRFHIVI